MAKDRLQTEQRLLDAVHEIITNEGLDQLRINKLAQQAKVNKILIYRYFGNLNGLIEVYYEKYKPVVAAPLIDIKRLEGATLDEFFQTCCDFILDEFRLLRANPQAQQFLKNDLMAYQPGVPNPMAFRKAEQLDAMVDELSRQINSAYGRSFATVVMSALTLLTFMGQDKRTVMGIDLGTNEGWQEIEQAVRRIFYGVTLATKERLGTDRVPGGEQLGNPPASTDAQEAM